MPDESTPKKANLAGQHLSDVVWLAMRALYEHKPAVTMEEVAQAFGVSRSTVTRRASAEGWEKSRFSPEAMSAKALELADKTANMLQTADTETTAEQVYGELLLDIGAEERAKIINRHREEWMMPRNIAYKAMAELRSEGFEKAFSTAKMAKITTETLKNIQDGERRAWGLDRDVGDKTVIIDRG